MNETKAMYIVKFVKNMAAYPWSITIALINRIEHKLFLHKQILLPWMILYDTQIQCVSHHMTLDLSNFHLGYKVTIGDSSCLVIKIISHSLLHTSTCPFQLNNIFISLELSNFFYLYLNSHVIILSFIWTIFV